MLTFLTIVYVVCAVLLTVYAIGITFLLIGYWLHRHENDSTPKISQWPAVAIQLPIYNERHVVERLLNAVAALDYPHDKLTVQVLDDSTDDTSDMIAAHAAVLRAKGLNFQHVQRDNRQGFKAGALAHGLTLLAESDPTSEFVGVFDSDFVPSPDFLRQTIPYLVSDPTVGMVQTRWGHINPSDNALTFGQTMALDGHFVVEQTARCRSGLLMSFSGSGGVWRTKCIEEAGGWSDLTLTEDLDLSYRAQLAGWHFLYLPDVVVPAEVPPQITAYKQQQARWAKGNTQVLTFMLGPLWRADLPLRQRIMATLHLCQYLPQPLMMLMLLLTPPLMAAHALDELPLGPLAAASFGQVLIVVVSQSKLYPNWGRRLLAFPVLLALGTGVAWNNTRAVLGALMGEGGEFRRTPKFASTGRSNTYALHGDRATWIELLWAAYALAGALLAMYTYPSLAPYLVIYGLAFAIVALWSLRERW